MQLKRMALVAGMTVAATAGLASQAWAAPADTSVTERQCFNGDGRVQRESDGVGTCVGGTNDGLLIDDGVDHTDDGYGTSSSRADSDRYSDRDSDDSDGYGRDRSDDSDATSRSDRSDSDDDDSDGYARGDSDDDTSSRSSSPAAAYRF